MLDTCLLDERTTREQPGQAKPPYSSADERMYGSIQSSDLSFGQAWPSGIRGSRQTQTGWPYSSLCRPSEFVIVPASSILPKKVARYSRGSPSIITVDAAICAGTAK